MFSGLTSLQSAALAFFLDLLQRVGWAFVMIQELSDARDPRIWPEPGSL